MGSRWKPWELEYLKNHATDGAEAIAAKLGRTKRAVEVMASKERISLFKAWHCPRCGRMTYYPLTEWTGWCRCCSIQESRDKAAISNRRVRFEIEQEKKSIKEAERERQALYSDTNKKKRKLRRLRESREGKEKSKGATE